MRSLRSHVHDGKAALAQDADVLPRVRVLGPLKELELGRFSGSVAQTPELVPQEAVMVRHTFRIAKLPDRYASGAAVAFVISIIKELGEKMRHAERALCAIAATLGQPVACCAVRIPADQTR